jgi:hypothetical protein
MHVCSRLQPKLLNQKDMCWLLKAPTAPSVEETGNWSLLHRAPHPK